MGAAGSSREVTTKVLRNRRSPAGVRRRGPLMVSGDRIMHDELSGFAVDSRLS